MKPTHGRPSTKRALDRSSEKRSLDRYAARRSFGRTPEPAPVAPQARVGPLLFVIQQHAARRLHYDLRLEVDGVLRSWAVPKGLPLSASERHLAIEVEDHPLAYGSFEGVIPAGEYGAGAVIVWDCGMYAPDTHGTLWERAAAEEAARAGLAAGKLDVFVRGAKLKGGFVLIRTGGKTGKTSQWLILKQRDRFAREDLPLSARSVLSGRTLEDMALENAGQPERLDAADLSPSGPREPLPARLSPMLAQEGGSLRTDPGHLYEPKLDGYRVLAFVEPVKATGAPAPVRLQSRGGIDLTACFPEVVRELADQGMSLVLDGEIVALGGDGRPSFQALQRRAQPMSAAALAGAQAAAPAVLVCFDLLHVAGINVRGHPYTDRRRYLSQALLTGSHLQLIHAHEDAQALYTAALAAGHEGIVAKRRDSPYLPGRRSSSWLKIKPMQTADLVVGGYTQGRGAREELGALLLGYWDKGKLIYAGHAGAGLSADAIGRLRPALARLRIPRTPFATRPSLHRPTTWLAPEVVVEVRFLGWTTAGLLRAPVFVRERPDLPAHGIARPAQTVEHR